MNSTKSALLKRHYKRQRMILNAKRLVIQTGSLRRSQFILDQSYKLVGLLPTFGFDSAKGKDKMGISIISGQRIKKVENFRIATAEEAIYEELKDKNLLFAYYSGEWSFYEKLRAYHLIEIAIAIAVGVYLWLK